MKKKLMVGLTLAAMLVGVMPGVASAETLTWTMGSNILTVDADTYTADTMPMLNRNGVVVMPVREVVEKMGGTVSYTAEDTSVYLTINDMWANITIGEDIGEQDVAELPIGQYGDTRQDIGSVEDGRLYIPAYLLAYSTGADMYMIYDEETSLPYRIFFHVR